MEGNKVAGREVDNVAKMGVYKVSDMVAEMEKNKVVDMVAGMLTNITRVTSIVPFCTINIKCTVYKTT